MKNPFEFGRELGSDELVNRVVELDAIAQTIGAGGKLFIIGPRRFGKTSLLKASAEKADAKGDIILRYNAESFAEIDALVKKIVEDSARLLRSGVERTGELVRRYFRSLRPEITFSVTQSEWKSSIGAVPTANDGPTALLVDALNGLEELASEQADRRVALIIDEFQDLLAQGGGIAMEKQIRSAIQTHRHTAYVFAGSKTRLLTEMTTDASRPFYRLGTLLFVAELPRPEFARFLVDHFRVGDFFRPDDDRDEDARHALALRILDLAEDVPYNVQMLAHSLWNRLLQIRVGAPEAAFLSPELIDDTLERLVRQHDPFYTQVWNGLTSIQKKAIKAVADEDGRGLQSIRVTASSGVSASSMRRSLESLATRDILRQDENTGDVRVRFEDPFFGHWIRLFAS